MNSNVKFLLTVVLLFAPISGRAAEKKGYPNILLIVADDLGYGDLGCYGCADIPTPNIDGIARTGVRFTDAHAYNVCSPTRASLMTGRYAERMGITGALMGKSARAFGSETTIATLLQRSGYATGLIGKWHLGYDGELTPTRKGFAEFYGFRGGKIDFFKHTDTAQPNGTPDGKHDFYEGDEEIFPEGYTTDLFTSRAVRFISDHQDRPFFLCLNYNAPHYAQRGVWQAPESNLKRFGAEGKVRGRGVYAAMCSAMDDGVGRVIEALAASKLQSNTLVIFMSDNGSEGVGSNAPFTGGKHNNREGGIRVPFVAAWPGAIPAGTTCDEAIHVIDLLPTFLAVAGVEPPTDLELDGLNVWPAFTGKESIAKRPLLFRPDAVREGRWKLLEGKLYDLQDDLKETRDLAAAHPEITSRLQKLLDDWKASLTRHNE